MEKHEVATPKVFISYSWSAKDWTMRLANRLVADSGIDVVIDEWDLEKGQDKYKFMERMVQDENIQKVLIICDKQYMQKANERAGGVGVETQILTDDVYNSVSETKYLPIIRECDGSNKAYTPHYLKPRIYIDLSDAETFEDGYADLVRAIYNKRRYTKPPLASSPPVYILDENSTLLPTSHKLNALRNALIEGRASSPGLASDYLKVLEEAFEPLAILLPSGQTTTTLIIKQQIEDSIKGFQPYRDEFIAFVLLISKYAQDARLFESVQDFFSSIAPFLSREWHPTLQGQLFDDNYRFIIGEMFLYTIAALIKHSRFMETNIFLSAAYQDYKDIQNHIVSGYEVFQPYMKTLDAWESQPHRANNATVRMLSENAMHKDITYANLEDVDFVLFARQFLNSAEERWQNWQPVTRGYELSGSMKYYNGMPLFLRATSRGDFRKLCLLLNVADKSEFLNKFQSACERLSNINSRGKDRCELHRRLMNVDKLDTL